MIEYEQLRAKIDCYLMERFKYRKSLVRLTEDNVITTNRNNQIDLYLRIRRIESRFPLMAYLFLNLKEWKQKNPPLYDNKFVSLDKKEVFSIQIILLFCHFVIQSALE